MNVTCTDDPDLDAVWLVTPVGNLDASGATQLWDSVGSRIDGDSRGLVIDMSGVEFLSSAGIGILARLSRRATRRGGTMSLFGVREGVLKVLRLCDLETVFNVSDTLEDAHAHFD